MYKTTIAVVATANTRAAHLYSPNMLFRNCIIPCLTGKSEILMRWMDSTGDISIRALEGVE